MKLDLSSLHKAVESLEKTLKVANDSQFMSQLSDDQANAIRAGVIQNFEFTYELCWKFMKRWLEVNIGASSAEGVARRELFRISAEHQLISDVDEWMEYHDARNDTSHTYDESRAVEIFEIAGSFSLDARKLLETLKKKND